ncbi:MAG: transglycosylase SLT domain-containing protein [Sulfurovum sp.]|nr:transglycosylase SLT domain-containing protein [Sulfurovum sp.]
MRRRITTGFITAGFALFFQGCAFDKEPEPMHVITKKIVKVESCTGNYHALNKKSGAYGRYQIMPKTARHYSKKLGIRYSEWKKPKNQDRIYRAILADNIFALKQKGYDINAFTVYGCHQQGANGFDKIMKNQGLTSNCYQKLRRNLPRQYRCASKEQLRKVWIEYWKRRMETI